MGNEVWSCLESLEYETSALYMLYVQRMMNFLKKAFALT